MKTEYNHIPSTNTSMYGTGPISYKNSTN